MVRSFSTRVAFSYLLLEVPFVVLLVLGTTAAFVIANWGDRKSVV